MSYRMKKLSLIFIAALASAPLAQAQIVFHEAREPALPAPAPRVPEFHTPADMIRELIDLAPHLLNLRNAINGWRSRELESIRATPPGPLRQILLDSLSESFETVASHHSLTIRRVRNLGAAVGTFDNATWTATLDLDVFEETLGNSPRHHILAAYHLESDPYLRAGSFFIASILRSIQFPAHCIFDTGAPQCTSFIDNMRQEFSRTEEHPDTGESEANCSEAVTAGSRESYHRAVAAAEEALARAEAAVSTDPAVVASESVVRNLRDRIENRTHNMHLLERSLERIRNARASSTAAILANQARISELQRALNAIDSERNALLGQRSTQEDDAFRILRSSQRRLEVDALRQRLTELRGADPITCLRFSATRFANPLRWSPSETTTSIEPPAATAGSTE